MEDMKDNFLRLVEQGNVVGIEDLFKQITSPQQRQELVNCTIDERTALLVAAEKKHLDVIQWIMTEGRAAGFEGTMDRNWDGETAFHLAVRNGDLAVCRLLVGCLKDDEKTRCEFVNSPDGREETALHIAVEKNNIEMIKWLMSTEEDGGHFDNLEQLGEGGGMTALQVAVSNGSFGAFLAIINGCSVENGRRKAILNARDSTKGTILHTAAYTNRPEFIKWLLSDEGGRAAGFDGVLARDEEDGTALHVAAEECDEEAFLALVEGSKVENGERAELLNALNEYKCTVLYKASWKGDIKIVRWLVSDSGRANGFSRVCERNVLGRTALHSALLRQNKQVFQAIVEGCKDEEREQLLDGVDSQGRMLLHAVAGSESSSIVDWLFSETGGMAYGFKRDNLFALTNKKENVLHIAAEGKGGAEIFDLLLSRCNDTSERLRLLLGRDDKGWTIFHHAARGGQGKIISHILHKYPEESKMIIDLRDNMGMTAIHRTIIHGHDKKSDADWNKYVRLAEKLEVVAALLGLKPQADASEEEQQARVRTFLGLQDPCKSNEDDSDDSEDSEEEEGRRAEGKKEAATNRNDENSDKKPAVVADPNVGLVMLE